MKIVLILAMLLFMANGTTTKSCDLSAKSNKNILLEADRDFSKMSAEKGFYEAFDFYMDDNATMYREGKHPYVGRDSIRPLLSTDPNATLTWEPTSAEIAGSGDLGYTLGRWEYALKDSTGNVSKSYGYYVSVWKKQADGSWKYVFDSGISGPDEKKKSDG